MEYSDDVILQSVLYLIIGGRDVMGAFNFEYEHMFSTFLYSDKTFPIQADNIDISLPTNYQFYNQIIE